MQSGITASQDLKDAFQTFLSAPATRGLLVGISKESLVPTTTVPLSTSFTSDLSLLDAVISETEASYILLKQDGAQKLVAVTFVPDGAHVRSKMLFASTQQTLLRELGTEHFTSNVFATTKAELTADGWAKHQAHESLAAPLTEQEKDFEALRQEELASSRGTTARSGGHVSSGVSLPIDDAAVEALQKLQAGNVNFVSLEIHIPTETINLVSVETTTLPTTVHSSISQKSPRYTFYAYASSTHPTPRILFIYTCPSSSSIKERMLYASSRANIIALAKSKIGIVVAKTIEAGAPEDVGEGRIVEEMEPSLGAGVAESKGFGRPKRPGRR